jgi:hypothetical protein
VWVTKGTNYIQHVYQHNIVLPHVQWQLAWWLDVIEEVTNHVKIRKKIGQNRKYGKKHRVRKRKKIEKTIKKEKKKKND